jgi:CBS domain-containing protein
MFQTRATIFRLSRRAAKCHVFSEARIDDRAFDDSLSDFPAPSKNCSALRKISVACSVGVVLDAHQERQKIMRVEHVMTRNVQACRPETNLSTAAMQMWKGDCGVLPVVTAIGEVIGMITDRDICMAAATKHRDPAAIRVKEVISGQVYACSPDADIHTALNLMRQKQVRRLPIINAENRKLVGILSIDDIALKAEVSLTADLSAQDLETTLRAICSRRTLPLSVH